MRDRPLAAAFDLANACNDLVVAVTPGASLPAVRAQLDVLLAPYGGRGAYGRDDQVSYRTVANELSQLRAMALLAPVIFLLVAAFILNVVLNRMIATQREQIATLKAFGYTRWEIGAHYLQFALLIVLAGAALGTAARGWGQGSPICTCASSAFRTSVTRWGSGWWRVRWASACSPAC
jgi:putative ABC transport system permease protein